MIDSKVLLTDLQREVTRLHTDLRARCDAEPSADAPLKSAYDAARAGQRTALTYKAWREEELTNVAVAWVLACVFIRFLEDNALVETLHLAGPDAAGLTRARDQQIVFFRGHPGLSEREYLEYVFTEMAKLPGMADLFDRRHNPLWNVGPTGDAARTFIEFWRRTNAGTGRPVHDFSDADWNSRFLGDLYQDLSEAARKRYALLQTPVFIEQFILDRTLTPAIETFGFRAVRMIDPTCGSGHFLLGGFARLHALWLEAEPGAVPAVLAQRALDQVFGVDLNPNVVAIARFRLLLAALRVTAINGPDGRFTPLRHAYDFKIHVAAGDSLLHGRRFREAESFTAGPQRTFGTEEVFRDELAHHYEVEDLEALHRILGQPYHAVVGNPPYITVKDRALSELCRARYPSCRGKYSLSVPFMERFFDLAVRGERGEGTPPQPAGFVGQITANSFMKREFGKKLIEEYLPRWDLTHVLDTAGAYIPGHGTPTVILFGKNQPPVSGTIRTVLGIRGEPATPAEPAMGLVWQAIVKQIDHPGSESEWMSAADFPRSKFHAHPWSIGGGGAAELKTVLDGEEGTTVANVSSSVGYSAIIGDDDVYVADNSLVWRRKGILAGWKVFAIGDALRDWAIDSPPIALYPHGDRGEYCEIAGAEFHFWLYRTQLRSGLFYGKTKEERGMNWRSYAIVVKDKLIRQESLLFAFVATHNHFYFDPHGVISNKTAPGVKLSANAGDLEHRDVLGLLNSSTICFWLKGVSQAKSSFIESWETRYEFDCTKVRQIPIPAHQPTQLPTALVQTSTAMQAQTPAATLAAWSGPGSGDLRARLASARDAWAGQRRQLIAWQEELDWQIYEAFGLVAAGGPAREGDRAAVSLPEGEGLAAIPPEGLALGERAFEIVLARRLAAGEVQTTWFERHGSTPLTALPRHWPTAYRELVERRIARIESDPAIRLIEQPEYKRRWNTEPWDEQFTKAARDWLLARLEGYFHEGQRVCELKDGFSPAAAGFAPATRSALTTTNQLAGTAQTDAAFLAVAEALQGGPGFSVPKLVRELVELASVPALPAQRYKPSGLLKRHDWEHVWDLQRREDAIDAAEKLDEPGIKDYERFEQVKKAKKRKAAELGDIPVPPKYSSTDFKKPAWWSLRGKLDVPKERWISYPRTERTEDPSPVIAWAGWDHAQQARALAEYYVDAKQSFGFPPEKLTLLLAGLLELQPWLTQWHHALDPVYGTSPAEAIKGFLDAECQVLGVTLDNLERVRTGV